MSFFEDASLVLIPSAIKDQKVYSVKPTDGSGDLTFSRATTAYRRNASGLIEEVASGVPRLDYPAAGGCPSLLIEPAATNLATLSTDYSGAGWTKANVTLLEDRNQPDPFGGNDASIIRIDSSGGNIQRVITGSSGTQYSGSFWIKRIAGTGDCNLRVVENANIVVPVTNEWQRFTATRTSTTTTIRIGVGGATIGDEFAIYQAQLETGPVSTSDIITGGSAVTRVADLASKTGIGSLIGATEGTLFAEVMISELQGSAVRPIFLIEAGSSRVQLFFTGLAANTLRAIVREGVVTKYDARETITTTGTIKLAIAYKSLDSAFYVNGVEITNVLTNLSFGTINFSDVLLGNAADNFLGDRIAQALLFKTRLSNSDLATLTQL
jgi:hypothetical protein